VRTRSATSPASTGPLQERAALAREIAGLRAAGRRVVLANGCFDLLHAGHVRYLEDARSRGDLLVVALNGDASVRRLKGAGRPLVPLAERAEVVLALRAVDRVVAFDEPDLGATLRALRPDVHAKGGDYTPESVPERAVDLELGIEIAICGGPKERSTSGLVERLRGAAR
jgi:D-glycero-beta-D-manno-heptose 1-phosphate adenylyltransferase